MFVVMTLLGPHSHAPTYNGASSNQPREDGHQKMPGSTPKLEGPEAEPAIYEIDGPNGSVLSFDANLPVEEAMKEWLNAVVEETAANRAKLGIKVTSEDVIEIRAEWVKLGKPYFTAAKEAETEIRRIILDDPKKRPLAALVRRRISGFALGKGALGMAMASQMVNRFFESEQREQEARNLARNSAK